MIEAKGPGRYILPGMKVLIRVTLNIRALGFPKATLQISYITMMNILSTSEMFPYKELPEH